MHDRRLSGPQFSPGEALPYIRSPRGEQPIALEALDVSVVITGLYAETTQILRFFNPNARDLEGELSFPLPDGAVVCGYGLDIEGELADGVVVAKQQARRILEAEIRKQADPGLVEQVQGNVYRTRIYPLPARGTRTVKIVYISELDVEYDDAAYHLPLRHAGELAEVALRVEVTQVLVEPRLSGGLGNLSLTRWDEGWRAEARLTRGTPSEDLQVRLPAVPPHLSVVERSGDELFFAVSSRARGEDEGERFEPRRLAMVWDASGSRAAFERDLALLEALAEAWPEASLRVHVLRDRLDTELHARPRARSPARALARAPLRRGHRARRPRPRRPGR